VYIDTPADVRQNFVNKIFLRVGTVGNAAITNYDMVADLDAQGLEYVNTFDGSDIPPI
jgi:hypothetical protein